MTWDDLLGRLLVERFSAWTPEPDPDHPEAIKERNLVIDMAMHPMAYEPRRILPPTVDTSEVST